MSELPGHPPAGFQIASATVPVKDLPSQQMEVRLLDHPEELAALVPAWQRLVETAIEPNVFYEPQMLLPAMNHLADGKVSVLVVEAPVRVHPDGRRVLCGLFPLRKRRTIRGVPLAAQELWRHDYCFLTTPLIRSDVGPQVVQSFLDWQQQQRTSLHFPMLSCGGAVDRLLVEATRLRQMLRMVRDGHSRAAIVRRWTVDEMLQAGISRKRRHELRRNRRRLEGLGSLHVDVYDSRQDPMPWLRDFLDLEANGWKGRSKSAIQHQVSHHGFFQSMFRQCAGNESLAMIRMRLNGKTIAVKINLRSGTGAFCFKIAYDENHSRFSPGVLLELENLEWLHQEDNPLMWMDSCAQPGHPMIEHIWPDRRRIQSIVIPGKSRFATVACASLPLFRAFKNTLSRKSGLHH